MKNDAKSNLILTPTPDGSYTLKIADKDETYHSVNGARTESQYVYIEQGLARINKPSIRILEVGFGTGLNAYLAWQFAVQHQKQISYTAVEKYPIQPDNLPPPEFIGNDSGKIAVWKMLHQSKWDAEASIDNNFQLHKKLDSIENTVFNKKFDIVFFDAFAPSVQPEIWSTEIFKNIFFTLEPGGILVTYSSAGLTKMALTEVGFQIERLKGPPGKKHMLRATSPISFL